MRPEEPEHSFYLLSGLLLSGKTGISSSTFLPTDNRLSHSAGSVPIPPLQALCSDPILSQAPQLCSALVTFCPLSCAWHHSFVLLFGLGVYTRGDRPVKSTVLMGEERPGETSSPREESGMTEKLDLGRC